MNSDQHNAQLIANELDEMYERLVEIEDYAVDMGWRAVEHKIQECQGRLLSAVAAAEQYADGTLKPHD